MTSVIVIDDYSPIRVGDTLTPFAPVFAHIVDGSPESLVGATISMKMQLTSAPYTIKICSGPWIIDDAANGQVHYQRQAADVDTPGVWNQQIEVSIGGKFAYGDTKELTILPVF